MDPTKYFIESAAALHRLANAILEGIPLSEFVVVVFHLVPLLEIQVVVSEKVVVVLWSDHLVANLALHFLVRVEVGGLVLTQLVIVVFVIEIVRRQVPTLGHWVPELIHHSLKTSTRFSPLLYSSHSLTFSADRSRVNIQ